MIRFVPGTGDNVYLISEGAEYIPADAIGYTGTHYICSISGTYNMFSAFVDQDFNGVNLVDTGYLGTLKVNTAMSQVTQVGSLSIWKFTLPLELSLC